MPTSSARLVSFVLLAALSAAAGAALAQRGQDDDDRRERADAPRPSRDHGRREDHRALSDAVRRVERRSGGQVLSAERVPFDGRSVNRVKVIDSSGRVRVYMDDPRARDDNNRDDSRRDDGRRTRRDDD